MSKPLSFFCEMQREGIEGDQFTFATVIRACPGLKQGKQVHSQIIKNGFEADYYVRASLVDSYAKSGEVDYARKVLGDILECNLVMCNAMIAGYAQNDQAEEAIKLFGQMNRASMKMDHFTFGSVLSAFADLAVVEYGKQIHAKIIKTRFELDDCVGNAVVDMYAKCGSIDDACQQFNRMHVRDRISWTALITGYAQNGRNEEALEQFCQMLQTNIKANQFTFASILSACASLASLEKGKQITAHVVKSGFETDVFVGGALIDMHAKCGSMEEAHKVFCKMPEHNVVSWTAMIMGYAQHGNAKYALQFFEQMQKAGMKPNHITFVGVLFACSHVGLVDEGYRYFDSMSRDYCITPRVEHYACMVDILGRAGQLEEAMDLINEMPFQHCVLVWRILLAACRVHGDIKLGKHAAERILELEPRDGPTYVLLSNAYAAAGKWNDAAQMRRMMNARAMKKEPACSWIEVKDQVHVFVVGDRSHPQTKEIYSKLQELTG